MGLVTEGITEVIAVTEGNAAPMGIIVKPGQMPRMVLYKGSRTAENVRVSGWLTANFVSDAYLYALYAFSDVDTADLRTVCVDGVQMQWLMSADAWMGFRTKILRETQDAYFVELMPVASEYVREGVRPVNRGFNSVIDAAVHATRYVRTHDPELKFLLEYHLGLVAKCGGAREREAAAYLREVCGL
mgnify:CR=1 FL=1